MRILTLLLFCVPYTFSYGQLQTENLVIVTLDGLRWQELFNGADSSILFNNKYTADKAAQAEFWSTSQHRRREILMPYFWNVIAQQGQLYGNRNFNNRVNCANPHWFSYPGYSEMLTGVVDRRIKSNEKIENPNPTVLEFINSQNDFKGSVAAFSTWDVIPYIIRSQQAGIPVNCGKMLAAEDGISEGEMLLNDLRSSLKNPHGDRYDAFTFYYAFEYLKKNKPKVVFISLDETDEHGHGGRYDKYLRSAYNSDQMIAKLWDWLQSEDQYKNKTTLMITTDHGRGKGAKNSWKNHGRLSAGSGQMWFALIGPDTPALGEIKTDTQYYQKQFAKTAASFLGLDFQNHEPVGETIQSMISYQRLTNR